MEPDPRSFPMLCTCCRRSYTAEQWPQLERRAVVGYRIEGKQTHKEIRYCSNPCRNPLVVDLKENA